MRNSHDDKLLGIKFESPNVYTNIPIHNAISYLWHVITISYQSLLQATEQGYQTHDKHRHAEDPPVRYILYYDFTQDEAYHRYRA